jgi:hypothetical protein
MPSRLLSTRLQLQAVTSRESGASAPAMRHSDNYLEPRRQKVIGWYLIDAFAYDKPGEPLFWSILYARFQEWQGKPDMISEMIKALVPNGDGLIN